MFLAYRKLNSEELEVIEKETIEDFGNGPNENLTWRVENDPCWPLTDAWNQFIKKIIDKKGYWIGTLRFEKHNMLRAEIDDANLNDPFRIVGMSYDKDILISAIKEKMNKSKMNREEMELRRQIDEAFAAKDWDKWRPLNEKYWNES